MLKKIISVIPIITVSILIIGIIKHLVYYNYFKLPIKHYLTINEIGSLIAEDILSYTWAAFSYMSIRILGDKLFQRYLEKTRSEKYKMAIPIVYCILSLAVILWYFFEKRYYYKIVILSQMGFLTILAVFDSEKGRNLLTKFKELHIIPIIVLIISWEIILVSSEIKEVITGKYNGTKIYTSDSVLISDKNSYYIGQTEKYLFLFNKEKTITILPLNEVKKIEMRIK